jgi:hypothetical protein
MKVINLNGTGHVPHSTADLLTWWEKARHQSAYLCATRDCITQPSAGGLVQRDDPHDNGWYIVPLCKRCNEGTGQDLDIWDPSVLVPVAVASVAVAPSRRSLLGNPSPRPAGQPA